MSQINFSKAFRRFLGLFGVRFKASGGQVVEPPPPIVIPDPPPAIPPGPPPASTPPTSGLRGQFVIPFIGAVAGPADRVFLAEIDQVWNISEMNAERVIDRYIDLGGNHIMTGPVWASGYHNEYPATNWLLDRGRFEKFLRFLERKGIAVSLVLGPDNGPFYSESERAFNWREMERLTDFYRGFNAPFLRAVSQWEQWQPSAAASVLFDWMRELFPEKERVWHSPPGHLSPGSGAEEERATWESATRHGISRMYLQAHPPDDTSTARPPIDQMAYDLWDMKRRFDGDASPWGAAILAADGKPVRLSFAEGTAHDLYNTPSPDWTEARRWRDRALTVVDESLDAL